MDETLLTDATRCPDCGASLADPTRCDRCGLTLTGPTAWELWQVSQQAAAALTRRRLLIAQLREGAPAAPAASAVAAAAPAPVVPAPHRRHEVSPVPVQNLLLGLGALLLVVAAVVFAVVAWGHLGPGGRGALLLVSTTLTGLGAAALHRRGLTATAEAVAVVTVAMALLDAVALRRAGLAGLDDMAAGRYASAALATVGVLSALGAWAVRLRVWRIAAPALGVLAAWVLAGDLAADERWFPGMLLLLGVAAVAVALVLTDLVPLPRDVTGVVAAGGVVSWAVAAWVATVAGLMETSEPDDMTGRAIVLLLVAGVVAGVAAVRLGAATARGRMAAALAAAVVPVVAAVAVRHQTTPAWVAVTVAAAALAVLLGAALLAAGWRPPLALVAAAAGALALATQLADIAIGLVGPLRWLSEPWSGDLQAPAHTALGPATHWSGHWAGGWASVVLLLLVTAGIAVAGRVVGEPRWPAVLAALPLTAAVALLPLVAGLSVLGATAWDVALGALALAVASARPAARHLDLVALCGGALLAVGCAWSVADRALTLVCLGVALVTTVTGAVAARPWRIPLAAAAAVLVPLETFAAVRAADWSLSRAGFALAVAGVLLGVAGGVRRTEPEAPAITAVAVATYAVGLAVAATDPGWASWTLALGGVAALAAAPVVDRRAQLPVRLVGALLLASSWWVRLALENVHLPEAYTLPPAVAALVAGHLAYVRGATRSSWAAYGAGLGAALVPTLVVSFDDPGITRAFAVGAAAIVVLLAGARTRLQAPLVIGAGVLAVDAVRQLAPLAAALPRWVVLAIGGVLLLVLGATYEQRRRDLKRAADYVSHLK